MTSVAAKEHLRHSNLAGAVLQESLLNISTVQSCQAENAIVAKYEKRLDEGRPHAIRQYVWGGLFDAAFFLILYSFYALGI